MRGSLHNGTLGGLRISFMATLGKTSSKTAAWTQVFFLSLVTVALILMLGSYHSEDPSLNTFSRAWETPRNVLGYLGSFGSDLFYQAFGWGAWIWPTLIFVGVIRWAWSRQNSKTILGSRWWIATALLLSACTLAADLLHLTTTKAFPAQGMLGVALSAIVRPMVGSFGGYLVALTLVWAFCMSWWEELPGYVYRACHVVGVWLWEKMPGLGRAVAATAGFFHEVVTKSARLFSRSAGKEKTKEADSKKNEKPTIIPVVMATPSTPKKLVVAEASDEAAELPEVTGADLVIRDPAAAALQASAPKKKIERRNEGRPTHWELPPLSLLEYTKKKVKGPSESQLRATAEKITEALRSFEIDGRVVEVSPGPIITMYEFQPASGVRVQRIMSAATDLAMTLGAPSVRIVAPIPGKSVAGIEVPNIDKEDIVLRDVFEQTQDRSKTMKIPLVLGKDAEGRPVVEDLSRMPHLLVGGATSMGKSVLVNSILTSLMCRFTPEELRLIIVDPKLVEFKTFEDIPHLLLPIVNDPNDASQALKWAVSETKRRYVLMQKHNAKNIESYNEKIATISEADRPDRFPYIVIVIDELAELMLTAKKDVENSIVRLTQLARAAGLHLIMATQRPSADVVTGLIKSNCPTRAALRVASASDSRIILDCGGAEQLLGRGDMFFTNTGPMGLRRMQSCFVSDGEIEKICDFWRSQGEPEYRDEILAPEPDASAFGGEGGEGTDDIYGDVLEFARTHGKISTSLIQRRFQIGYTRAARIMEQLEARGVVGEQAAAGKARDVIL